MFLNSYGPWSTLLLQSQVALELAPSTMILFLIPFRLRCGLALMTLGMIHISVGLFTEEAGSARSGSAGPSVASRQGWA